MVTVANGLYYNLEDGVAHGADSLTQPNTQGEVILSYQSSEWVGWIDSGQSSSP